MKDAPLLSRMILAGFVWVFFFAAAYLLLEPLGLWSELPAPVARGIDVATGLVLLATLMGHLVLATGALPRPED